jgi:hypothetical protein
VLTTINPIESARSGDDFEIEQSLDPDPAKFFHVAHRGDSMNDRAKDDRHDVHLDQTHESISQRFQALAETRINVADHDAEEDANENLDIKNAIPGFPPVGLCINGIAGGVLSLNRRRAAGRIVGKNLISTRHSIADWTLRRPVLSTRDSGSF